MIRFFSYFNVLSSIKRRIIEKILKYNDLNFYLVTCNLNNVFFQYHQRDERLSLVLCRDADPDPQGSAFFESKDPDQQKNADPGSGSWGIN